MKKKLFKLVMLALLPLAYCACGSDDVLENIPEEPNKETPAEPNTEKPDDNGNTDENGNPDEEVIMMLPQTQAIELTAEQKGYVAKSNDFSFNLFRAISADADHRGKSLITSPLSVSYVLGMLNDGAQGQTSDEITQMLGYGAGNKAAIDEFCHKMMVEAPQVDPSVVLEIANIVIGNKQVEFEDSYEKNVKTNYFAEVTSQDFALPTALDYINGWCNERTHGMIPKILDELSPEALVVLMNAIYFKATWSEKFDPEETKREGFTGKQKLILPMMHRKAEMLYAQNDTYAAINLPYGGGDKWSMMVLLPNEGKTVEDVIASLSEETWKGFQRSMTPCVVDVKLPRFSTESEITLNEILPGMGVPTMFSPSDADFSPMTKNFKKTDDFNLFVGLVKQKAAVEVAEEGTKLSAVTIAGMCSNYFPNNKADFHANRPFVYVVQEASSGAIFFVGTFHGE